MAENSEEFNDWFSRVGDSFDAIRDSGSWCRMSEISVARSRVIIGSAQGDLVEGAPIDQLLFGGTGNDTFFLTIDSGNDTIADFLPGENSEDIINVAEGTFSDFEEILSAAVEVGGNTIISIGGSASVKLIGVGLNDLNPDDFVI